MGSLINSTFCNTVVTFRKLVEYDVLVGVRVFEYL